VSQWTTFTPDGRRLIVKRHQDSWTVACADNESSEHELLEVALTKAIRQHSASIGGKADYAAWIRHLADQIERGERRPDGDELGERGASRQRDVEPHMIGQIPFTFEGRASRARILPPHGGEVEHTDFPDKRDGSTKGGA
jgi:hypothetical protein